MTARLFLPALAVLSALLALGVWWRRGGVERVVPFVEPYDVDGMFV